MQLPSIEKMVINSTSKSFIEDRKNIVILKIASLALFRPKELVELVLSSELHREQLLCLPFTFGASHVDPFVLNSM